ncbi:hypothetical protein MMC17_000846 [Xylographa soralifera]|nr:hypothetical protein [Xylographa soralifera]
MLRHTIRPVPLRVQCKARLAKLRPHATSTHGSNAHHVGRRFRWSAPSIGLRIGTTVGLCGATFATYTIYCDPIRLDNSPHRESFDWNGKAVKPMDFHTAVAWLRKEENSQRGLKGSGIERWDSVRCASNCPCEDMLADAQLPVSNVVDGSSRSGLPASKWSFWGVYDGHAGSATSAILRMALIAYVADGLSQLYIPNVLNDEEPRWEGRSHPSSASIEASIKSSFCLLDDEIVADGIRALRDAKTHTEALARLAPGYSGSCALLAAYNPSNKQLHVACTGDSRAVLGRPDPKSEEYIAVPLSADQTGFNKTELARLRAEHPEEPDVVNVKSGRTLEKIAVTRAFGDGLWKWPLQVIEECHERFWWAPPLSKYKTPPYLTAEPLVTTSQLWGEGEFLILASDGLWDHLTNEQAVNLVRMWQKAYRNGTIGRSQSGGSQSNALTISTTARGFQEDWQIEDQNFVVEDENAATHLVRNVLGGKDQEMLCGVVGAQVPLSREVRDDITVQVIFFENTAQKA